MPRSHRTASPTSGSSSPSSSVEGPAAAAPESSTGFRGFLDRAGETVGSNWNAAKQTVGGWVDGAGQAVGELSDKASQWGRTAGEASDLDYDIGWGNVSARGSLSDVLEIGISAGVVPPDLKKILEGATATNIVALRYDYAAGELVVEAQDLQVRGVAVRGMQIGTANLTGVRISVRSDKIELLGSERRGSQAELHAAQCEALDVRYQTADGPMQAARMQLTGLTLRASSKQGQVLEGDVSGSVQVDGAAVEGFSGGGVTMDAGSLTDVSADLPEGGDGGSLRLGRIEASGVTQGGASLGNASADGVQVDVTGAGGALRGEAPNPETLAAQVRVRAATVDEFHHPMASLSSGALDEVMLRHDARGTSGTVGGVRAEGLDTSWADADELEADALSVQRTEQGLTAGAGRLSAQGVRTDQGNAARVEAGNVAFDQSQRGSQASVGEVRASGIDADAVDARGLAVRDVQAGWSGAGGSARVGSVRADGVTSAQGGATSVSVGASEGQWRGSGDGLVAQGRVGALDARGVTSDHANAERLTSSAVSVDVAGGATSVRTDHIGATGVTGQNVGARSLDARGVSAELGGADVRAGAQRIDANALSAYGATVGQAQLTGAQVTSGADGTRVGLGGLEATNARYQDLAAAGRLTASDAQLDLRSAEDLEASVGAFRLQDLAASNFRAGDVRGSGIGVDVGGGRTTAEVDRASLTGARIADRVDVASGQVGGVTAAIDGSGVRDVSLQSASVSGVHDRTTGSRAAGANLAGVRYANSADRMSASVDQLGVTGARFDTGPATGSGSSAGAGGPQLDTDALLRSATRRVDDADVAFDIGVNPMQSTFADIAAGTRAQGRITARDNQLTDARVGLTNPVDGPLWIEGRGAYTDDQGRLRADLDGWYDHKVGGFVNDALGVQGDRLPSVSAVGEALTRPGTSAQGQGSGTSPVDLADSRVHGSVGLSAGRIDAGMGQMDLATGRAGDNVVQFDASGGRDVAVAFSRILASGISADTGSHQVRTGQASVSGGSVNAATGNGGTRVSGELDAVDVAGLRVDGPGTAQPTTGTRQPQATRPEPRPTNLGAARSTYTVRTGDTLSGIARQNGTTVAALAAANGIADPARIRVGQVLQLQ